MLYAFAANVSVNKEESAIIRFRTVKDLELEAIIFKMGVDHTIKILQDLEVQVGILQTIPRVEVLEGETVEMVVAAGKEAPEVGVADQPRKICDSKVGVFILVSTYASATVSISEWLNDFNPDHMGMNYNISDYDNNVLPQTQKVFHAQDFGPNAVISNQTSAAPSNQEIAQFSQKYTAQAGIASKQESEFLQNEAM